MLGSKKKAVELGYREAFASVGRTPDSKLAVVARRCRESRTPHDALHFVRFLRHSGSQHFRARVGDEHVVLDANAADVFVTSEHRAIERALEIADLVGMFEKHRNPVKTGLDRHGHAGQEIAIEPEVAVAE